MTVIDFTELGQHHLLRLERESGQHWLVINVYGDPDQPLRRGTLLECVRFMDVVGGRDGFVVDEASVDRAFREASAEAVAWVRSLPGFSVRVADDEVGAGACSLEAEAGRPASALAPVVRITDRKVVA